jgi:hypothetical protein
MTASTCLDFLTDYLRAVRQQLAERRVVVTSAWVHQPMPQQALGLSLELAAGGLPEGADVAGSAGVPGVAARVPPPRERIRVGWHEELGWWAEPADRRTGRRYFPGDLVPSPDRVADYLAGLTRNEDLGSTAPSLHRYRLLDNSDDLVERLDIARRTAAKTARTTGRAAQPTACRGQRGRPGPDRPGVQLSL